MGFKAGVRCAAAGVLLVAMARGGVALPLQMVATPWSVAPLAAPSTPPSTPPSPSRALDVPAVRLSGASVRGANALYVPRDPRRIPAGFARACAKAGGFAPRGLWDDLTNGVTPWFESPGGAFLYYRRGEGCWYVDDRTGAGLYRAPPADSLLLPPTGGWTALTGRRRGAPTMTFVRGDARRARWRS